MKIYTKTGDDGKTSLFGGSRVYKSELRIESYGTVDELNSYIGLIRDGIESEKTRASLKEIQDQLFVIGAELATEHPENSTAIPKIQESHIELMEKGIDQMETELKPLKNFILPGGHPTVSHIHIARCVSRRAERQVVKLSLEVAVNTRIVRYLNRLSDYLFVLARFTAKQLGAEEIYWKPDK